MRFREILVAGGHELGIEIREDMLDLFHLYYEELIEAGKRANLTAIEGEEETAVKHFLDSLTCLRAVDVGDDWNVVDVGSGAGFPGIPLKVARPSLALTLIETSLKRVRFLETLISKLGLSKTEAVWQRAEEAGQDKRYRENCDLAVARGVAELAVLSELCLPFVRINGVFVALKGPGVNQELLRAESAIQTMGGQVEEIVEVILPWGFGDRSIVVIRKKSHTPGKYPRRPGIPNKRPIV